MELMERLLPDARRGLVAYVCEPGKNSSDFTTFRDYLD
jgi:hypothetical protein